MKLVNFTTSILFLLVTCNLLNAQPHPIQPKTKIMGEAVSIPALRNPDRGYHTEIYLKVPTLLQYDLQYDEKPGTRYYYRHQIDSLGALEDSITLVQQYFYIPDYLRKNIDEQLYMAMDHVFSILRDNGLGTVLRFAYNYNAWCHPETFNETEADILRHIKQLTPWLRENIGQIATLQAGFIGYAGEWHSSYLYEIQSAKNNIVSALLEAMPEPYTVEMRYPIQKRMLTLADESQRGRLGFHDDYFVAGEHPLAHGNDYVREDYVYVKEEVEKYNPYVSAEMAYSCDDLPEGVSKEDPWLLNHVMNPYTVLSILNDLRYSAFDIVQNNSMNVQPWKKVKVNPELLRELGLRFDERYFQDENGNEVVRSMYQFIRDHLGYRLNLKDSARLKKSHKKLNYDFTVTNTGFARPVNPRNAYLVLIQKNEVVKEISLGVEINKWLPMAEGNNLQTAGYRIQGDAKVDGIKGKCKVGIWIPSPSPKVRYNHIWDIKLAPNNTVEHWWSPDGRYAVNIIGEVKL